MKKIILIQTILFHFCLLSASAQSITTNLQEGEQAHMMLIPVDSKAFVFSPGNWVGDDERIGKVFRQTWNPGAYFRVSWSSPNPNPRAKITFDISSFQRDITAPKISYNIDGIWYIDVRCDKEIIIQGMDSNNQQHDLTIILSSSAQMARWGSEGISGTNVLRVTGVLVDEGSQPLPTSTSKKWVLIIGDSITEGIGTSALSSYSYLLGQAFRVLGYEYGINACGYSGWLARGDQPPGDVPAYYCITGSENGKDVKYNDAESRWNKIDGNHHSLLDSKGRLSAYGQTGQEPDLILINYGTNDFLRKSNPSDLKESISQGLKALRNSAPNARIIVLIPFGQYLSTMLNEAVEIRKKVKPIDSKISIIDLGPNVARSLTPKERVFGDLHPNDRGAANFIAMLIPQVISILNKKEK